MSNENTAVLDAPNGHADADVVQITSGPRIPRREVWLSLPAEYGDAGMKVKVWSNVSKKAALAMADAFQSEDEEARIDALAGIVLEHNGWLDDDGQPLPSPSSRTFWELIPNELAAVVIQAALEEVQSIPNGPAPTKPR